MASKQKREWEVRVRGQQLEEPDIDLLAQIVIMLGRQLAEEAVNDDNEQSDDESEE
ncbi:MAG: hypothetical protein ACREX3_00150 [Gammaproteobacteria bacterium]